MLYRAGGAHEIHGGRFDYAIVQSAEEEARHLAAGWATSTAAALAEPESDDAAPTRAEMLQKATSLGIKVDGRWSDAKLLAAIDAAVQ